MSTRKRHAAEAATDTAPEGTAQSIIEQIADSTHIPDEHAAGHANSHSNGHVSALDRLKAHSAPKQTDKPPMADPHFFESVALTEKHDGPKLRLGRSNRHKEMLIKFDEKPGEGEVGEAIFTALKDKGFRWNRDAGAWTLKMDPAQKWRAHQDAEKLFRDIGNTLREQNGLGPVTDMGHSAA
jgi:hypothetical protein